MKTQYFPKLDFSTTQIQLSLSPLSALQIMKLFTLLMMTAESMLSKRQVLAITVNRFSSLMSVRYLHYLLLTFMF